MKQQNEMPSRLNASLSLSREEIDFQLSPSLSAKDAAGVLDRLAKMTEAAKQIPDIETVLDTAYGVRRRQKIDLFRPSHAADLLPCLVFLHGGFWQLGDKSVSGFAAPDFVGLDWAYASIGYTLTPEISLAALIEEIRDAVVYIQTHGVELGIDPARIILVGHSAGAHLAAAVVAGIGGGGLAPPLAGAVLISGVFDLAPIARSYVADLTPMTQSDVTLLSPMRYIPTSEISVHLLVGADEPEAFLAQSEALLETWGPFLPRLTLHNAPGCDHFDVLFELTESRTLRLIKTMV